AQVAPPGHCPRLRCSLVGSIGIANIGTAAQRHKGRTTACRRRPTAYASLQLPGAPDAQRSAATEGSLSRLNHWLPRGQAYPEVVEGTAEFHHQIADAFFPQAEAVFDDATTLDTTVHVLDPQPTLVQRLVRQLLLSRQLLAPRFPHRHEDVHLGQCER